MGGLLRPGGGSGGASASSGGSISSTRGGGNSPQQSYSHATLQPSRGGYFQDGTSSLLRSGQGQGQGQGPTLASGQGSAIASLNALSERSDPSSSRTGDPPRPVLTYYPPSSLGRDAH